MGNGKRPVDYGMAEALAFGSLVKSGTPVRLCGQDSRRGTFNQRHSVLIDVENDDEHTPLQHVAPDQARFEVYDSMLSEAAVLGFEYGYSRDFPEALVLLGGAVRRLRQRRPDDHRPVHLRRRGQVAPALRRRDAASARLRRAGAGAFERAHRALPPAGAEDNLQVCQPSTAAQYFHLLRRQALRRWRKPLVVFTPKSMLRHKDSASPWRTSPRDRFQRVIRRPRRRGRPARPPLHRQDRPRAAARSARSGGHRDGDPGPRPALSLPQGGAGGGAGEASQRAQLVWVQEEPANMGALFFVQPRISG